jgi:aminoglycoside phosphotransferase (APT) family kinase protein
LSDATVVDEAEIAAALSRFLSGLVSAPVTVNNITRLSTGWESDVFAFDAPAWRQGERVLRLYFGKNAGPTALHEYRALDFLARAGYPAPQVDTVEESSHALGRSFLIMHRIQGTPMGQLWRDPDPGVRQRELERFCRLMIALHTLEWQDVEGAATVPTFTIAQQLGVWEGYAAQFLLDAFRRALDWLHRAGESVSRQPLGLAHWDFHHENILVDKENRAWVIDWTQFQATDTRFDLAWTLTLLASERDAATAAAVRAEYFRQRGWEESEVAGELQFFEAGACAKRLLSVLISMRAGADALGMRPGAEAIMSSRLPRFAVVYRRWLELTATSLPEIEGLLAGYLQ